MGFTIEQDEPRVKAARRFHVNASLREVQLLDCSATMAEASEPAEGQLLLGLQLETSILAAREGNARFAVRIIVQGNPKEIAAELRNRVFEVACRYGLQYALKPGYVPSQEDLDAFKEANAVFNCWPYAREFVQNVTMRMGLQIPALPLLHLVAVPSLGEGARSGPPKPEERATALADRVREHTLKNHIEPARTLGEKTVVLRVGDIHREMGLRNRQPAVAAALGANTFEEIAHVRKVSAEGPLMGANLKITFELL